ncbi:hypothetical protein BKA67DRAFT_538091 [Truncatella angustata]|uniref:Uncharacterized protein n=1 Tax=Truncatella angustata TaxID=152316 RepID=A0A9P8UHT2_9PEZI|nr:uncharacterized protein BKA67DRAFT_538091 [Truncatella angustata]KAH6652272.1 hypothetical protein BKA67DRAFT_538091 [Truncatella angustata]
MPSHSGGTHWSEEVMAFFQVREMEIVSPDIEDYDGVNLIAHTHLQIIRNQRTRLYDCIDRLQAFPFLEILDDEIRELNYAPKANCKDNEGHLNDANDTLATHVTTDPCWGWGTESNNWSHDNTVMDDDDYDFFGSNDCATVTTEWPPRERCYPSAVFAALITRLNTKFPHAFQGNERTVSHTEYDMCPYIEAADFLTTNAQRYRGTWLRKQQRAFNRVTALRIPNQPVMNTSARQAAEKRLLRILNDLSKRLLWAVQQRQAQAVVVDWNMLIKDSRDRMAKRKAHKKTSLATEYHYGLA